MSWISNVRVLDVAHGLLSPPQNVLLSRGAIADFSAQLPADAAIVFDGHGRILSPGLIDGHVHLFLAGNETPLATYLSSSDEEKLATARQNAAVAIRSGITTVRDCGGPSQLTQTFREGAAQSDGSPHVVSCGSPLTRPSGHCHFMGICVSTPADVRSAVEQLFAQGNEFVKIMASGGGLTPGTRPSEADFAYELMQEAVAVAHANGKMVAAHCHATESIRRAVCAGVDVIEHASFVHSDGRYHFEPMLCEQIRNRGIVVCPTIAGALRSAEAFSRAGAPINAMDTGAIERLRGRFTNASHFHQLGVKMIAGTDCGITATPFDSLVEELLAQVQAGMSNAEALRSATSEAAGLLRLGRVGEVKAGYRADLIVLDEDPLQNLEALRKPVAVLKSGKLVHVAADHGSRLQERSAVEVARP